ncbi:MAG: peptide deformylase [Microbacteriaceae bacterium]|mgnify:FL=1|jgi:peptide deformylase|nr:peptide deformylase [Microbacteriaceae bacterium]
MAERPIRLFGDPILTSPTDAVDVSSPRIRELVTDLLDTVKLPGRAGVAANQIGVGLRAFSYNIDGATGYLLNPRLVRVWGDPEEMSEGCLSVPGLTYPRLRYPHALAEGYSLDGELVEVEGSGLMAQAIQHELDHLEGVLYFQGLEPEHKRSALRAIRESDWFAS